MRLAALVFVGLVCVSARRVQTQGFQEEVKDGVLTALANFLRASNPSSAFANAGPAAGPSTKRSGGVRPQRGQESDPKGMALDAEDEFYDVIILGAGLSGICVGWYLQREKNCRFAILDRREDFGGMWAQMKFPGLRTDTVAPLYGYSFHPSPQSRLRMPTRADLLSYFAEVVDTYDLRRHMLFEQHILSAQFQSKTATWTLTSTNGRRFRCRHLMNCMGYFDLWNPYIPDLPGMSSFQGKVVHAYSWTDDVEYENKSVVLIGSGSTAVTAAPAIAQKAAKLTYLQRSPGYITEAPLLYSDRSLWSFAGFLIRMGGLRRRIGLLLGRLFFWWTQRQALRSSQMRLQSGDTWGPLRPGEATTARAQESTKEIDNVVERFPRLRRHFTPSYYLFEHRQCFAPGSDFFNAIDSGKMVIHTAQIDTFTESGIKLKPLSQAAQETANLLGEEPTPEHLPADLVVLATGMRLNFMGDLQLSVDDCAQATGEKLAYHGGLMISGIPNMWNFGGYFKGPYTRRVEIQVQFMMRVLRHMRRKGLTAVVPMADGRELIDSEPQVNFLTGATGHAQPSWKGPTYVKTDESLGRKPRVGMQMPWRGGWNLWEDMVSLKSASVQDGILQYSRVQPGNFQRSNITAGL